MYKLKLHNSISCYILSLELHVKEEIAELIARSKAGLTTLTEVKKSAKGVVGIRNQRFFG
jgi:programmed cell death 6-interacting protein